jgi:shikimate dehydrogenase
LIKLGLIGDNILTSRAPKLHKLCGQQCGLNVQYDLLIPKAQGLDFDHLFQRCADDAYHGLNITLPYKVSVMSKLHKVSDDLKHMGAANTVVFKGSKSQGFNTDYTGFIAAYQAQFGNSSPGVAAIAGAGGAGRAVAFALAKLGAAEIRIFDAHSDVARKLVTDLAQATTVPLMVAPDIATAADGADGLVNCTPLGMVGYGGSAFPEELLLKKRWIFDAVYQPMETQFISHARAAGVEILHGYELHFYQGILAFQHFTGHMPPDLVKLRRDHLDETILT